MEKVVQLYAKPSRVNILRFKNNIEIYVKLHPRQRWKVTSFKEDSDFVGVERDTVSMILDKECFNKYFVLISDKGEK